MTKFVLNESLSDWATEQRNSGLKIGFTCGAFDILHSGHVHYLQQARSICDRLLVAINSDSSIQAYKDPLRPIIGERSRMELVAALSCVDAVTLMAEQRPIRLIEWLKPDFYIKGGDYAKASLRSAATVESYGGQCVVIPVEHEVSSSAIIARIQELSLYASPERLKRTPAPIVFLDRDGTLIKNVPYINTPSKVELLAGVGDGLKALQDAGFRLVVITNQQGIGLGNFDYETFVAVNSRMLSLLSKSGVQISRFYFCPHSLADHCECRKPGAKLIERALLDFEAIAEDCYLIGDSESDIVAAERAGCKGILLGNSGFYDAAEHILAANELNTV